MQRGGQLHLGWIEGAVQSLGKAPSPPGTAGKSGILTQDSGKASWCVAHVFGQRASDFRAPLSEERACSSEAEDG
jgi:hypothetical protein